MPDLKLMADLSHYVVGRELPEPATAEDDEQIHTILRHSWGFHGRVANGEQVSCIDPDWSVSWAGGAMGLRIGWPDRTHPPACPLPVNSVRRRMQ